MVLLDRDGTLNRRLDGYVTSPEQLELLPGALQAVAEASAWARVVVVTNQQGVGRGLMSAADLDAVHAALVSRVEAAGGRIDAFHTCPHLAGTCSCRKPGNGLFRAALAAAPHLRPADCLVVGDMESDVVPALRLGMRAVLLGEPARAAAVGALAAPEVLAAVRTHGPGASA